MANNPFDEEIINTLERPLSSDINMASSYSAYSLMSSTAHEFAQRASFHTQQANPMVPVGSAAFLSAGFLCQPISPAGLQVTLTAGLGFFNDNTPTLNVGGISGLNAPSVFKPLTLTAAEAINIPAADPSNTRIDIIEVLVTAGGGRRLADSTSRDILNTQTGTFVPAAVFKTLTYNLNGTSTVNGTVGVAPIIYKTGTPSGSPSAPSVDAGYVKIAEVTVGANVSSVSGTNIRDFRVPLLPGGYLQGQGLLAVSPSAAQFGSGLGLPAGVCAAATFGGGPNTPIQANIFFWPAPTGYSMNVNPSSTVDSISNSKLLVPQLPLFATTPTLLGSTDAALLTSQGFVVSTNQPVFKLAVPFGTASAGFTGAAGSVGFIPMGISIAPQV